MRFILNFISEVLSLCKYILGSVFVLVAIGGTIVLVRNIQNGSYRLARRCIDRLLWLISMAFSMMFYLSSAAADLLKKHWRLVGDNGFGLFSTRDGAKKDAVKKAQRLIIHIFFSANT